MPGPIQWERGGMLGAGRTRHKNVNPCPGTVLGRAAGSREFSWPQPACFLTEPDVRSPRQSPVAVNTSSCPGQADLKDEEQDEDMRSQDE